MHSRRVGTVQRPPVGEDQWLLEYLERCDHCDNKIKIYGGVHKGSVI